MMKKIFMGLYALALVCAVCACSREDDGVNGMMTDRGLEITFSGSRVGEEWVDSARTVTRATDDTWTDNDEIGIYVLPAGATALTGATKPNSQYVYSSGTATFSPASLNQTLYYPYDGANVNFVAYYPWNPSAGEAATANTVTFDFDAQGTKELKEAVDFCFHRGTESYSKANHLTSMAFQHKFSKIRMTVKRGTSGINLTTLTGVTLKGMPASATVDLNTLMSAADDDAVLSAFTISGETDITAYIQSKTSTQAVVEAIIAPHTIVTGKTIELAFSGDPTRTYTFEQEFTLDPGKVYDFVFTLKEGGDGMTNCYMVKPGDPVTFPVSRAYTYNATTKTFNNTLHVDDTQTYTGEFDAAVVWADELVIKGTPTVTGSGNTAEVRVETNATPANGGNAVVAIKKKGTQEIVWSYHIWVSKYKPDDPNAEDKAVYENQGNTNDNGRSYVFMDRNLGATFAGLGSGLGTGLFYQWGRKDPFPATDGTLPEGSFSRVATSNSLGTINNTIENPNVFLYNASTSPYDWHWASRNDELWNTSNNEKTIYDPCPSGWRVPRYKGTAVTGSPWYGFTTTSKTFSSGWEVDTNAIYPAAGLRLSESVVFLGRIVNEGSVCYHWSATPGNESAMCTHFDSVRFHFDAHLPRSRGCCVRCVRE